MYLAVNLRKRLSLAVVGMKKEEIDQEQMGAQDGQEVIGPLVSEGRARKCIGTMMKI